jgi:hypothetical protein
LGPSDEMPCWAAIGRGVVGEPSIEVGLAAGAEGEPVFGEPLEEGDRRVGALAQRVELLNGGGAAVVSLPQSADQLPDRVAVQDLPLFGLVWAARV